MKINAFTHSKSNHFKHKCALNIEHYLAEINKNLGVHFSTFIVYTHTAVYVYYSTKEFLPFGFIHTKHFDSNFRSSKNKKKKFKWKIINPTKSVHKSYFNLKIWNVKILQSRQRERENKKKWMKLHGLYSLSVGCWLLTNAFLHFIWNTCARTYTNQMMIFYRLVLALVWNSGWLFCRMKRKCNIHIVRIVSHMKN